jgi:hypothetical protein
MAPGHLSGGDPRYVFQRVQDLLPGLPAPVDGNHRANDVPFLAGEEQERHDEELSRTQLAKYVWPRPPTHRSAPARIQLPVARWSGLRCRVNYASRTRALGGRPRCLLRPDGDAGTLNA